MSYLNLLTAFRLLLLTLGKVFYMDDDAEAALSFLKVFTFLFLELLLNHALYTVSPVLCRW